MKKGLFTITNKSHKIKSISVVCVIAVILSNVIPYNVFAAGKKANTAEEYIGKAKAKSIALKHAGISASKSKFIKVKLDNDDGHIVYDVEFYNGNTEYDYEIDAISGEILEYDHEIEHFTIPKKSTVKKSSKKSVQKSVSITTGEYIGQKKAKSIALSDAKLTESQVSGMKIKLERENGIMVYEVEFDYGRIEYEYEIDAINGTILKTDVDYDD